ncbi:hypothetical protein LJB90_02480 [Eubacteriales bacterium OttesenSCG-928-G02]|nr:hypothetical protein [Eubacteriales bacterium OttesenSCG-928-G02]
MDYNAIIEKIMPEVESGSNQPIMIYRDIHGGWHGDFTRNQYGDEFDWVEEVQDPFAVTVTGADMSRGSFPYVYDRILNERLRAEYETAFFKDSDPAELNALINLFEENMGEFSSEVTDYLTTLDRPLAAAYEMTSISLKSNDPNYDYDSDKIGEFVDAIENAVEERLNNREKQDKAESREKDIVFNDNGKEIKLSPGDYTVLQSQHIRKRHFTLSENPQSEHRYMVCEYWENPHGIKEHMESGITNDYLEALDKYLKSVHYYVRCAVSEREPKTKTRDSHYPSKEQSDPVNENDNLPLINMELLENVLRSGGFSNQEVKAIWHTVWDYSGDWLNVVDERFAKSKPAAEKQKQPEIKAGDFIDYDDKRWHVGYVDAEIIQLTNMNSLDNNKEIRASRWKTHIKEYTVVDKSEVDMTTLKPQKQKPSLAERIENGKEKVRKTDKNKDKPVKPKNKNKGVDD